MEKKFVVTVRQEIYFDVEVTACDDEEAKKLVDRMSTDDLYTFGEVTDDTLEVYEVEEIEDYVSNSESCNCMNGCYDCLDVSPRDFM